MATPAPHAIPVGPDTLVTVKVIIDGTNRRFKLALRDLGAHVLPQKLRFLLAVPPDTDVLFERYSDSAGSYVALDSNNPAIYKQLYRAAKAKLKLRIKATVTQYTTIAEQVPNPVEEQQGQLSEHLRLPTPPKASPASRHSYLDTVLSPPREEEDERRHFERSTIPAVCDVMPEDPEAVKSLANYTNETVETSVIHEKEKDETKSMTSKLNARNTDLLSGQAIAREAFCIDCNNCGKSVPNEHYHCGICDNGDFDLCPPCIAADVTCDGEGHWLIKRRLQDGLLVSSFTETIAPKKWQEEKGADKQKGGANISEYARRTCNSCINEMAGKELVTCTDCVDYDLCMMCFSLGDHGHHPAHRFQPISADTSQISSGILPLCERGRGIAHAAICDGCNKLIFGVRHKCLSCPDWDYCSTCVLSAAKNHPGHRLAALYEPISDLRGLDEEVHFGIYCDGPLCSKKSHKQYIQGTRYKCAVCHDTDFCANCEAVPSLHHNRTHPLIKFRTPVKHVSVTTLGEKNNGQSMGVMGDHRPSARNAATETTCTVNSMSTATQVQTVAEVKPVEAPAAEKPGDSKVSKNVSSELQAWFECDSIPDGSKLTAERLFTQSWKMRNPGPHAWPAGCAVYFTGGDHMLNVDTKKPSSVSEMAAATKSTAMGAAVEPGQTATFTVLLKSPEREGRAISYWRLKTADGIAFGHKLWVDITVAETPAAVATPTKCEVAGTMKEELEGEEVKAEEVKEEEIKDEVKDETVKDEEIKSEEGSSMIFPKLDRESPVTSVHGPATPATAAAEAKIEAELKAEEAELVEELESLGFEEEEEEEEQEEEDKSDDGFLTDEEYDILNASDEDALVEGPKAGPK